MQGYVTNTYRRHCSTVRNFNRYYILLKYVCSNDTNFKIKNLSLYVLYRYIGSSHRFIKPKHLKHQVDEKISQQYSFLKMIAQLFQIVAGKIRTNALFGIE